MSKTDNKEEKEKVEGKKFLKAYFKVPVTFSTNNEGERVANFKEVDHKKQCYKVEELVFETSAEAIKKSTELQDENNKTLRMAALSTTRQEGDLIKRVILCNDGEVTVNPELANQ